MSKHMTLTSNKMGGIYLYKKMIEFTRLFAILKISVKTSFLLLNCTKNTSKQQISRIKNPPNLKNY